MASQAVVLDSDGPSEAPFRDTLGLTCGDPAITMVKYAELMFLTVVQVNGIQINS